MDLIHQTLAVLFVFSLLGFALWKLRRIGSVRAAAGFWNRAQRGTRWLESVERLSLTPQHTLHLVRMHGREVVVATHPQGCSILTQSQEPSERANA